MDSRIEEIFGEIEVGLIDTLNSINPAERNIYACSFWFFYCDGEKVSAPCLAYNCDCEEDDKKWSPPDWKIDIEDKVYEFLTPIYKELSDVMSNKTDEEWDKLVEFQYSFYCRLCLSLNSQFDKSNSSFFNWSVTDDFVIGIFEEREEEDIYTELVKNSIGQQKAVNLGVL